MKIVHAILSDTWGGAEAVAASLASAQASNHTVCLLAGTSKTLPLSLYRKKVSPKITIIPYTTQKKSDHTIYKELKKLLPWVPDIVHTHLGPGSRVGNILKNAYNTIAVGHMHKRFFADQYLQHDGVICVSPWQLRDIPKSYMGEYIVAENYLAKNISSSKENFSLKTLFHKLKEGNFIFGFIGRLVIQKNVDLLLRAFKELHIENSSLVIIGDGDQRNSLENYVTQHNIHNVYFLGHIQDAHNCMQYMDVIIIPSRFESFGLVAIEAISKKIPVIVSSTCAFKDIFENRKCIFSLDDKDDLIKKMKEFYISRESDSLTIDINKYSIESTVTKIDTFYNNLMQNKFKN